MKKIAILLSLFLFVSCDPISDTYIDSVKDGNGKNLNPSGNTEVNPSVLTITFKEEMDSSTINSTNIDLLCGSYDPDIEIVEAEKGIEYQVNVPEAWRYALLLCELKLFNKIKTKAGQSITNKTYSFTNSCAVSDDFNAQSISDNINDSCWQIFSGFPATENKWSSMSGFMAIDSDYSDLVFDFESVTGAQNIAVFYKEVSIVDDFDIEMYFSSINGVSRVSGSNYSQVELIITDQPYPALSGSNQHAYKFGIQAYKGKQQCYVSAKDNTAGTESVFVAECSNDQNKGYYVWFKKESSVFTRDYSIEAGSSQRLQFDEDTDAWKDLNLTGDLYLYLIFKSPQGVAGAEYGGIGYIDPIGLEVTGQY